MIQFRRLLEVKSGKLIYYSSLNPSILLCLGLFKTWNDSAQTFLKNRLFSPSFKLKMTSQNIFNKTEHASQSNAADYLDCNVEKKGA